MADNKPTTNFYRNLGGINQKASEYSVDKAQFLNLRNLDFDVPNALQKRPGSTQAIGLNSSGPITSLFEFQRLDGASYVIAGTDTAQFYMTGTSLTILDPNWNNGQPTDMLTFVNKLWMANGQNFKGWSGVGATAAVVGLPCSPLGSSGLFTVPDSGGASIFTVAGATMFRANDTSYLIRGVFVGYSYVRQDGYYGPADLLINSRNAVYPQAPGTSGEEYFTSYSTAGLLYGFTTTVPTGVSAVAIWIAVDSVTPSSPIEKIPGFGDVRTGDLGFVFNSFGMGLTLKPNADLSRFYLYTLIAPGSFVTDSFLAGVTATAFTLWQFSFNSYTGIASGSRAFTGTPFCWFDTNTPKYIEVNQNVMFSAGFSNTPSTVWFSEIGQPEIIQPESSFEVRTNDGDRIWAIKAFNNNVIILKQNSFHKVIGDSPENFELVELSGEYGCISDKTVVEYREKLVWLDQKGIVEYNGAGWDIISTPVEDMFRRMNLNAAKEKAVAVHQLYRNQIWWGIPIDGATKNNLTVVYDYLVDAWTFFDGFSPSSFAMIQAGLTKPTVWRGDYSGMIYYHGESFLGENGQGISCVVLPHWDKGKENETWIWRRFFLDVATASGLTGVVTGKYFKDYNSTTVQGTFSMYQDAFQSRAELGVPGKAVTAEFSHYSASLPLLINGYSWAKRFLRNV